VVQGVVTGASAAIAARSSCRTFDGRPLDGAERSHVEELLAGPHAVPFGNPIRFALLDPVPGTPGPGIRLGTYGVIRGAPGFLAGAVREGAGALEDYGYALERIVLALSVMGLGTCWLAGTFRRGDFADRIGLAAGEILPAVTPVGHPAARPSPIDALLRTGAGSARRRAWEALFSVSRGDAGAWAPCLDAVRQAPSAANGQPWRIAKEPGRPVFHLGIAGPAGDQSPRRLDAGIAMCHFALVAAERGLPGRWIGPSRGTRNPLLPPGVVPVASWNPA
jgi:hypothetical protein